jgi:hypothetical protein
VALPTWTTAGVIKPRPEWWCSKLYQRKKDWQKPRASSRQPKRSGKPGRYFKVGNWLSECAPRSAKRLSGPPHHALSANHATSRNKYLPVAGSHPLHRRWPEHGRPPLICASYRPHQRPAVVVLPPLPGLPNWSQKDLPYCFHSRSFSWQPCSVIIAADSVSSILARWANSGWRTKRWTPAQVRVIEGLIKPTELALLQQWVTLNLDMLGRY